MRFLPFLVGTSLLGCGLTPLVEGTEAEIEDEIATLNGLEASSASIDFGTVEPGNTELHDLVLTNTSADILVIADALIDGDGVFLIDTITALPAELEPDLSKIISLSFSPSDELDYGASLVIQLEGVDELMSIELIGVGEEVTEEVESDASISVDMSSIDFGEVDTWSENFELVTITNDGSDDVLIRNLTSSDSYYSYSGDLVPPNVMSSGSSKSFYVVFAPQAEGSFPASFTVETDINTGTDFEIALNGSAIEPDCEICTPSIQVNTPSGDEHLMNFLSIYNFPDEQLISIQNLSDVEMTISDAYISNDTQGGTFSLAFSPVTLGPWETTSAAVSFTCPEICLEYPNPISDTNILHILSDDPTESDYQVELWTGF